MHSTINGHEDRGVFPVIEVNATALFYHVVSVSKASEFVCERAKRTVKNSNTISFIPFRVNFFFINNYFFV